MISAEKELPIDSQPLTLGRPFDQIALSLLGITGYLLEVRSDRVCKTP
jgi:hypothetical protein